MKLTSVHDHPLPTGVLGLAVNAAADKAYVSCADGSIQSIALTTGSAEVFDTRHESFASDCVLLPDGKTLITAGYDGWLLWHDIETRRCWRRVRAHQFWNWQIALSPDGRQLATVTGQYLPGGWKYEPAVETEPSVKVFDTRTGDLLAAFSHGPPVLSCAFSPDGRHLAAGNMMGDIKVWSLPSESGAAPVSQWNSPDFSSWGTTKSHHYCGGIYDVSFSPDGQQLVGCGMGPMGDPMAGNGKMTWQRWNWQEGKLVDQIKDGQHGTGLMEALAFHPSGQHFLMAGRQAQGTWNTGIFSTADGSLVHSLHTQNRVTKAVFSEDGKSVILAGAKSQDPPKNGVWPSWGRIRCYSVEA